MIDVVFEPLGVADKDFHIAKSIDQCPPRLMMRESMQNAFEAPLLAEENGIRYVVIRVSDVEGVPKLTIWNGGQGMTPEELVRATDLASSIRKPMGLDGRQNRGEGAKVASLPWNRHGFRIRSCHDGRVSEVMLRREGDVYVRERVRTIADDGTEQFDAVWDITEDLKDLGDDYDLGRDWTEVTLLGNSVDQPTAVWPYGVGEGRGDKRAALTEIFDRFHDFPETVRVFAADELHGRKSLMELRPIARIIRNRANEPDKIRAERVTAEDGVVIEYVYLPLQSGNNNLIGRHELTGDATRIAIVWRNEMYDAHIRADWKHVAASFGAPYIHRELSIFIHLPDDYPVRDGAYRRDLVDASTGELVTCSDFAAEIRDRMPDWLRKLIEQALAPKQAANMADVERALEERLKEAKVKLRQQPEPKRSGMRVDTDLEPAPFGELVGAVDVNKSSSTILDPEVPSSEREPGSPRRPPARRNMRAAKKASASLRIRWLDNEDAIEAEELTYRAAKYVEATNTLFMNALHSSVVDKLRSLETHYSGHLDLDDVRLLIVAQVQTQMALHVGTAVVHALAKVGHRSWTQEEVARAWSKESLTVAAENTDHLLGVVRQRLSVTDAFKAARAA